MACDYRVMIDGKKRNAWMCMNEVSTWLQQTWVDCRLTIMQIHFGAAWPASIAAIMVDKISSSQVLRKIGLEGHRFTPDEAVQAGFVDHLVSGNTEDVLKKAQELAVAVGPCARGGTWGLIRVCLFTSNHEQW